MPKQENSIIIYQDEDGVTKVSVKFSDEDIWLTQNQIAEIYKTTRQNIEQHINNIYEDEELKKDSEYGQHKDCTNRYICNFNRL